MTTVEPLIISWAEDLRIRDYFCVYPVMGICRQ